MCPGVEADAPGACPKCGMALEKNPAFGGAEDDSDLHDMTRRTLLGAGLALPVLVAAMGGMLAGAQQ